MSDAENPEVQGEEAAFEPQLPPGMSEAQVVGGPPPRAGLNAVPLTPPPGGSFTFWAHGDGGTMTPGMGSFPSLYLVYHAEKEEELLAWADGITAYVKGVIYIQRRIRARSVQKAAERAAQHPQQLPPHRPRRVPPSSTPFVPPQPSAQFPQPQPQPGFVPPSPQPGQPQVRHRPHPNAPAVSPQQLAGEAEVARARVENKRKLAEATALIDRFASSPEGAEHLRRVLADADTRRASLHPPGSAGAAAAAAAGQPIAYPPAPPPPPPMEEAPAEPIPPQYPNGSPQPPQ